MSDKKPGAGAPPATTAAPSTAIQPVRTMDEIVALLKVDERTSDGREDHEAPDFQGGTPWLGYRSPKSKKRVTELDAAQVVENTFYVFDNGIIKLTPTYVTLLASYHFYSRVDDDNNILGVSAIQTEELKKQGFSDHLIGVVLVRLPGEKALFKAATFSQRKAMTRAFDGIRSAVKGLMADKEAREWKARGLKHQESFAAAKWPQFAVRAKIWGKVEAASKPGGRDFNLGLASVEPTPVEDVKALNRYFGLEPEAYGGECKKNTEFANVLRSFGDRRAEMSAKLAEAAKEQAAPKK